MLDKLKSLWRRVMSQSSSAVRSSQTEAAKVKIDSTVCYLERGLYRHVFKLEHVRKGCAVVLPSRYLIVAAMLFERPCFPNDLLRGFRAIGDSANRVPYEVPGKDIIAFCPLDMDSYLAAIDYLVELSLLAHYEERGAYNPDEVTPHRDRLILAKSAFERDPDFVDYAHLCNRGLMIRVNSGETPLARQLRQQLGFAEACVKASLRDGHVPLLRHCDLLFGTLVDCFPQAVGVFTVLRTVQSQLGRIRMTGEELAELRECSEVRQLRADLHGTGTAADVARISGALLSVLQRSSGGPRAPGREMSISIDEGSLSSWPNADVDHFPERSVWASADVGPDQLLLAVQTKGYFTEPRLYAASV